MAATRASAFRPGSGGGSGSGSSLPDPVTAAHGGTGLTTLTSGSLLTGAGTGNVTFTALPLSLANGGTGAASQIAAKAALLPATVIVITESSDTFTIVDVAVGDIFRCALTTGTNTIAKPGGTPYSGQVIMYRFEQDGTGGRTVSFDTSAGSHKFTTSYPVPTLSTGASVVDDVFFRWSATSSKYVCIGYNFGVA